MSNRRAALPAMNAIAWAILTVLVLTPLTATPAALALAQSPAGNGGREPAPNLIISVDDSGSMGDDGMAALKAALQKSFSTTAMADNSIRLGFQAMWRCRGLSASPYSSNSKYKCPDNRVQFFSGTHRSNFNTWVNGLDASSWTPSHQMFKLVDDYMGNTTGIWSPFANKPGVVEEPKLACRKTFHIFMTDGGWNATDDSNTLPNTVMGRPGNADGSEQTLPDGVVYSPYGATASQTRVYRDDFLPVMNDSINRSNASRGTVSTLADWAFHLWATDYAPTAALRKPHMSSSLPTLGNEVRPIIRQAGPADYGTGSTPYMVSEYWNPKNNPMTWQGVTTYTIGFNEAALQATTTRPTTKNYDYPTGGTGSRSTYTTVTLPAWSGSTWGPDIGAMIRGDQVGGKELNWGNPLRNAEAVDTSLDGGTSGWAKRYELWHAALNGRGRFVPATNATELSNAFAEIVTQIVVDSSTPMTAVAANTQTITSSTRIYTAGYDSKKWSGYLQAKTVSSSYALSSAALWDAAGVLDASTPANRLILSHNGTAGIAFEWAALSTAQKNALKDSSTAADATGQNRLLYIRGDRSKEQANASGIYRDRASRLGSIVNANLWVVGKPELGYTSNGYNSFKATQANRTPVVYVGANDGMLHAFSGVDGKELMAYIPQGVYGNLKAYTDPAYTHRYFVDGTTFTGDIHNGSEWKTMLVGTLAGGGKGYFVLDVTAPGNWQTSNAGTTVVMDKTDGADADIGHLYAEPTLDTSNSARVVQITKLNNNRWAALLGNGVNSASEKAVLLIQYLDGSKELEKITLDNTGGNGNGLAHPQVIDINGDGKADVAYAGDMQGNLWKVDLTSATSSAWGSYFKTGSTPTPLFVAKDASGARQPITTAPQWATHPIKGLMLSFGTGREITAADRTATSEQTLYGVWDNSDFKPKSSPMMVNGSTVANGRTDLIEQTQTSGLTLGGQNYFKTSTNAVIYTGSTPKRGWYMTWTKPGERSVSNGGMLSNQLLYMRSRIPASGNQTTTTTTTTVTQSNDDDDDDDDDDDKDKDKDKDKKKSSSTTTTVTETTYDTEESCEPNAKGAVEYLTVLDIVSGKPPSKPVFDTDGGGFTGTEEKGVSRWESGKEDRLMMKTGRPGETVSINTSGSDTPGAPRCSGSNCRLLNPNLTLVEAGWRQLQ